MVEIAQIKTALRMSEVVGRDIQLRRNGAEFMGLCPFHPDKNPSFTINDAKGFGKCFSCGWHGDVVDYIEEAHRMDKRDAIQYAASLAGLAEYDGAPPAKFTPPAPTDHGDADPAGVWQALMPVPDDAPPLDPAALWNPKRGKQVAYRITHKWAYTDEAGRLLGYVLRYSIDGDKITPQITYCENTETGERRWVVQPFPKPRPLYGLHSLALRPTATVVLVEGEKAADAAAALFPRACAVTWPGGGKGMAQVDWRPLAGRNVVMIPDADTAGLQAAWGYMHRGQLRAGVQQLIGKGCRLVVVEPPAEVPQGWDVADANWTPAQAGEWLSGAVADAQRRGSRPPLPDPHELEPAPEYDPAPDYDPEPPQQDDEREDDDDLGAPFKALGHYKGKFYYLPNRGRQLVEMQAMAHRELNLMQLAPLHYWEATFPARGGNAKVDWKMAADSCMMQCLHKGLFNAQEMVRGRGAWLDNGRAILHLGESIVVDGIQRRPQQIKTRYTYQADISVEVGRGEPVGTAQANKLVQVCRQLSWENPRSAILLAGWCVIAPVCGILPWRPHIWVTGGSGSGKSTVVDLIIRPVVGPIALRVASVTTESGIRQALGSDARPVIFDEAESEDKNQAARMQAILDLGRAASQQSGAQIIKGTASHSAQAFDIRSCFCFSSINTAIRHFADETRVTVMVLRPQRGTTEDENRAISERYDTLKEEIIRTFTPGYSAGLLMRTMENLRTLRDNIEVFGRAAAVVLGSRRAADQIAPMLAGAFLLHSTKSISVEEALHWLRENDMREATAVGNGMDDEMRLFSFLMAHRLRVTTPNGTLERTVGEAIEAALHHDGKHGLGAESAQAELRRFGIRIDNQGGFYVSTTSDVIKRALADTPWGSNWARPLRMLPGADHIKTPTTFSPGIRSRAIWLPSALISND